MEPLSDEETVTEPSSSISISALVCSMILFIIFPPAPIIPPIFSGLTFSISIFGAFSESSFLDSGIVSIILSRIYKRAIFAFSRAISIIFRVIPSILISICIAVIPSFVPVTLKSISPR